MNLSKNLIVAIAYTITLMSPFLNTNAFAESANAKVMGITSDEINVLADIAAINKTEILLATIASNKQTSSDVKDLASLMMNQHGSNLTQLLELANSFHLQSLSSSESKKLTEEGNQGMMKLGGLQGDQFDKAYVDAMVKGHQAALNLIDNHLMKAAKTESIKKFLSDTRTAVAQHLEHAKKLQENMKS